MRHIDIVEKLIGPIKPVGETNEDKQRLENLKIMCGLIGDLIYRVHEVKVTTHNNRQYSVNQIHNYADRFLKNLEDATS